MRVCLSVCQIRVVNAFQEPSTTPAQLPYKGRPSFASIVTMTARTAAVAAAVGEAPPSITTTAKTGSGGGGDVTAAPALVIVEDQPAE